MRFYSDTFFYCPFSKNNRKYYLKKSQPFCPISSIILKRPYSVKNVYPHRTLSFSFHIFPHVVLTHSPHRLHRLLKNRKKRGQTLVRTLVRPNLSHSEPFLTPFNSQRYQSHFLEDWKRGTFVARFPFFLYVARMSGTRPLLNDIRATSSVQQPFRLSVRFARARTRTIPGPILDAFPRPLVDRDVRRTRWIPHTALLNTEPSPVTLTRPSHFESWISTTLAATPGRLMV